MKDFELLLKGAVNSRNRARANHDLGDRSKYIGLSDIAKAVVCPRWAVASKLNTNQTQVESLPLRRILTLERGHWFEAGVYEALASNDIKMFHQLSIHSKYKATPIIAHLDFVLVLKDKFAEYKILVVEVKSTKQIPETAYAAHETQVFGQIGLLKAMWNLPSFSTTNNSALSTFSELLSRELEIKLQNKKPNIEGLILYLSMDDFKILGPYKTNKIMTKLCLEQASFIWSEVNLIKTGAKNVNDISTRKGFHPLCDYCDFNRDCPRFESVSNDEVEEDLLKLKSLKDEIKLANIRLKEKEEALKELYKDSSSDGWIKANSLRFKVSKVAGRKNLDKELLIENLKEQLAISKISNAIGKSYKKGQDYERFYISKVNSYKKGDNNEKYKVRTY